MSNNNESTNDLHDKIIDKILELKGLLFIHNVDNDEKYTKIISQLNNLHVDFTLIKESQNK